MEYQKIIKLLYDTTNQQSKFRANDWVDINEECIMPVIKLDVKLKW